jgi:hypothetical protein
LLQEDESLPDRDQVQSVYFCCSIPGCSSLFYFLTDFMLEVLHLKLYFFSFGIISTLQDLKPRFHTSRFHGSDSVEDDVSYKNLDMFI